MDNKRKHNPNDSSSDDDENGGHVELQVAQQERPLEGAIRDLLGENFRAENYALVSMLTMIAVMFMFQTDIIAFQEAVVRLSDEQITALTLALGGPINISGITDPDLYSEAVTEMYENFAATMNIPPGNIPNMAGMVEEIVRRNTEMQQLLPAGWTFPSVYGEERRFASLVELGNRLLSDATHPVSQLFSTIITSLRRQLGIPSMVEVITSINENAINYVQDFVRDNPRLDPVRAYYHAVLGIFNGDGDLWEDLQNISTITAFNQYYHIYAGVFVAFFVALRNTVTITGYVARGIVNLGTATVSFAIGPDLYYDIVREIGNTTRNIARLPVTAAYYTARFVIFRVNSVVNFIARALTPISGFELFMGDTQEIQDNMIVGERNYTLLNADSFVDYDTFIEMARFLRLLMSLSRGEIQNLLVPSLFNSSINTYDLARDFGDALDVVLAPEQNIRGDSQGSEGSEMTVDTTSSRASSVSVTYGSNPALMVEFFKSVLPIFITSSAVAVIKNPRGGNPAVPLIEKLTSDVQNEPNPPTSAIESIRTEIIPNVGVITGNVVEDIEHPQVFENDNMNVVSSAESSQDSNFSANEAVDVISNLPNSTRLGGRKRKSRAKKQKGGKRRKTMKKSKKSKLRKPKTLKRRKSHRRRKTRKI